MTKPANKPENEMARLAALRNYKILDTLPEQAFDDLAKIAASICDTPVSLVSLVDDNRQWFKASNGVSGVSETERDIAFCAHAILDTSTFIVKDALKDERFQNNPLVTGPMAIRFYAGAPLVSPDGYALGALCAIDQQPRELSEDQQNALEALARQTVDQMELRLHIRRLNEQAVELKNNRESSLRRIIETMQSGLLVIDQHNKVVRSNRLMLNLLGYTDEQLTSIELAQIVTEDLLVPLTELTGDGTYQLETFIINSSGLKVPVLAACSLLPAWDSGQAAKVIIFQDLTSTKAMQAQLLTSQKLEAVGRLAAGVAHEINTPIQFIGDNTRFVLDSVGQLFEAVNFIKRIAETANQTAEQVSSQAAKLVNDLDLNFLIEEIPAAIEQTLEGVQRVSKIVQAMKEFSHPGSDQKQLISINKLIESTVTVSSNEWKYVADINLDLDRDLPLVPCLPGEINQVLLNLIVNSAHALEQESDVRLDRRGKISISTKRLNNQVCISIADNGCGISPELLDKIFEPFFTTKVVGKGTGQGLAIARSVVVDKHKGEIKVSSQVGQGTEFEIYLPLEQADNVKLSKQYFESSVR